MESKALGGLLDSATPKHCAGRGAFAKMATAGFKYGGASPSDFNDDRLVGGSARSVLPIGPLGGGGSLIHLLVLPFLPYACLKHSTKSDWSDDSAPWPQAPRFARAGVDLGIGLGRDGIGGWGAPTTSHKPGLEHPPLSEQSPRPLEADTT